MARHPKSRPDLSLSLKPATAGHDCNTLVHDKLADGQIARDPRARRLRLGQGVVFEAGAGGVSQYSTLTRYSSCLLDAFLYHGIGAGLNKSIMRRT